jgi:ABC-type transport system involved in multi-copper enzyme maturation permease subunit
MAKFLHILKYTAIDILHQKSFFIMLAISIGFVMLLRGCYKGNYMVNGQAVDGLTIAWHASIIAFHIVSAGVLLIAAILSMNLFSRDRDDGTLQYVISKPVHRYAYVFGRAGGVWIVASAFMFVLHLTIFIITLMNAGGTMPGYLTASCICSANVLFMVLLVCLLSLYMPDFAAAFTAILVVGISYVSDGIFQVMQSALVQSATGQSAAGVSAWRMAWPKVSSLQYFAASLVDKSQFHSIGPVHPVVNILVFICITAVLLAAMFQKKEV